ncbi:MAG: hypothetical protein LBT44_04710, partial [Clostridiales bacterium]|nr:hypothetical protein [Clostridiales bacterium]
MSSIRVYRGQAAKRVSERRMKRRIIGAGVFVCLCEAALLGVIGYQKLAYGDDYERKAVIQLLNGSNNIEQTIQPGRGFILDRNRQPLAVSENVYDIILDVKVLNQKEDEAKEKILTTIADLLDMDVERLHAIAADPQNQNNHYYILQREAPVETAMLIRDTEKQIAESRQKREKTPYDLSCVYLVGGTKRNYTPGTAAPQVIGFIRGETHFGLESSYNQELAGEPGRIFRAYAGADDPVTEEAPAIQGYTLITTLDAAIQEFARQAVDDAAKMYEPQHASVLVMNPNTGEVLAMAQYPSFDANAPASPDNFTGLKEAFDSLPEDERLNQLNDLWNNFNIYHLFEPGSIFKPVVASAALEENIVTPEDLFTCSGHLEVAGTDIACWIQATGGTHGEQNLTQSLANSCNVAMMKIAQKLGRNLFFQYRNDFGFGEKTGVDLPGEASASSQNVMYTLQQL